MMLAWFHHFPNAEPAIITNEHSGIICLDCDKPPYPPEGVYTDTPSGGRHYWYELNTDDARGIGITDGKDIPWIVKIYAVPFINEGRIPLRAERRARRTKNQATILTYEHIPWDNYIDRCEFMAWFNAKKDDNSWDGRYPLARAYASNIANSDAPSDIKSLGIDYQHEETIYSSIAKPITCSHIVASGFACPHYDPVRNCCSKDNKSRSPYGLATN